MKKQIQRRLFLSKLASIGLLANLTPYSLLANVKNQAGTANNQSLKPYLQLLTPTSVRIKCLDLEDRLTWLTISDGNKSWDEYQLLDGQRHSGKGIKEFVLEGLQENKLYRYEVKSKIIEQYKPYEIRYGAESVSEKYSFKTPSSQSEIVSCIILNDLHDRGNSIDDLLNLTSEEVDFIAFNGDTFNHLEDEQQILNNLLLPIGDRLNGGKPFVFSRGNHETRGKYSRNLKQYFAYPNDKFYYSFVQGSVRFIVLDAGEDKPDDTPVYAGLADYDAYRIEQAKWLDQLLRSEKNKLVRYNVVLMHIPPFHSGDWHGVMHCRHTFHSIFEKYKIDLLVSGHTHRHGFHAKNKEHNYPIIIGGAPENGKRTLIKLSANRKELKITMIKDDGSIIAEERIR